MKYRIFFFLSLLLMPLSDMIPSSRTQKYKNLLGGILCPEKVKLMQ